MAINTFQSFLMELHVLARQWQFLLTVNFVYKTKTDPNAAVV